MPWKQIKEKKTIFALLIWTLVNTTLDWGLQGGQEVSVLCDTVLPSCSAHFFPASLDTSTLSAHLLSIFSSSLIGAEQQWAQHICQQLSSVSSSSSLLLFIFSSSVCPPSWLFKSIKFTGGTVKCRRGYNLCDKRRVNVKEGKNLEQSHICLVRFLLSGQFFLLLSRS